MSEDKKVGSVKWFNNKAGYGYIVSNTNEEYYVHFTDIRVTDTKYRYLVQGEYVSFDSITLEDGRNQAKEVRGVNSGKLMCEVNNEKRIKQNKYSKKERVTVQSKDGKGQEEWVILRRYVKSQPRKTKKSTQQNE